MYGPRSVRKEFLQSLDGKRKKYDISYFFKYDALMASGATQSLTARNDEGIGKSVTFQQRLACNASTICRILLP